jgi:hypothetical protein
VHVPLAQTPFSHFWPVAHGVALQLPQWSGSDWKSKHDPLHSVSPGRHSGTPARQYALWSSGEPAQLPQ